MDIMNEIVSVGRTDYDRLLELVIARGMDKKWARMFIKKLADDERAFPVDDEMRKACLRRGFYPGRASLYGVTEEGLANYLPDYPYFMIHPINHHFRIWINDKLSLKYTLNSCGCAELMPDYYLYVENNGNYTYLMDAPADIMRDEQFLLNLLKQKGTLAIKPNSGTSGGRGFMKVQWQKDCIWVNNKPITMDEWREIGMQLQNCIVTEYAKQHHDLDRIWPHSECTLRVIMVKLPQGTPYEQARWHNIVSYARMGSSVSGGASNLSSGGIGIGFDFETGQLKDFGIRYKKFCPDGNYVCYEHPDTHVAWKDCKLPNWDYAREKIMQTCQHIGSLDYLGLDIILTEDGMKYCEINTHPAADYEQIMCGPILADDNARAFFAAHGLFDVDTSALYDMYMKSQIKSES